MADDYQSEYKTRLERLKAVREAGTNPFPSSCDKKNLIEEIKNSKDGKSLLTAGRLMAMRDMGKLAFGHIEDQSGRAQIALKKDILGDEKYKFFVKKFDLGDFVSVKGSVFTTHKGEKTLLVEKYELLSKALLPMPEKFHGLKDEEERLRKRYLDMISNPEVRAMFIKKAKYYQVMRDFLRSKGFVEVETPVLETTTGGADARPFVTHHNALDIDVYLRISVGELWQKKLMVGGFEKTFEMGRIFRNEGMDAEHLQDYTSMEYYWAYANWDDSMKLTEELVKHVAQETFGSLKFKIKAFEIDLNNFSKNLKNEKFLNDFSFAFAGIDTSAATGKRYMPLLLSETLSDYYFQNFPRHRKEEIIASNISGVKNLSASQFTGQMYVDFNFYKNFIKIIDKEFVSPLSISGPIVYKYTLIDTALIDNSICYHLAFSPKRKHEYTFQGDMWIADTSFALKRIDVNMSKTANFDFVSDFYVKKEYKKTENGFFFPSKEEFFIDFNISKFTTGFFGRKYTSRLKIKINPKFPAKFFPPSEFRDIEIADKIGRAHV